MELLQIDGSMGEGGGQIIRTSLTMAAITQKPFRVFNIRLQRKPKPHLQPQHLMAARAVCEITDGNLEFAELGSNSFIFYPNGIRTGEYEFNVGTAGSCILVAQTIIPILLMAKERSIVRIIGGTSVPQSPGYDYFINVFLKAIACFHARVSCSLVRSGYYPRGNGLIEIIIDPSSLKGCSKWEDDAISRAIIRLANLPGHIAEREKMVLVNNQINKIEICEEQTLSPGNVVTLWQGFKGCNELGKRGIPAEVVAETAIKEFRQENGNVDRHLADQLLIYAALAHGPTVYSTAMFTKHLFTNRDVIGLFVEREIELSGNTISSS